MNKCWNWARDGDERVLYLNGVIAEETWYADDVSPAAFRAELFADTGPVTVYINSPGGCCVAASQIYTMLMEYPHDVTVKIDGLAASAASVIAMAGTKVLMAPTALMMMHRPLTVAMGNTDDMRQAIHMLEEVKESILNAYEIKTGLSRAVLSHMMDSETWLSANKAVELGFADGILDKGESAAPQAANAYQYSSHAVSNLLLNKLRPAETPPPTPKMSPGIPVADLEKRLALLH